MYEMSQTFNTQWLESEGVFVSTGFFSVLSRVRWTLFAYCTYNNQRKKWLECWRLIKTQIEPPASFLCC